MLCSPRVMLSQGSGILETQPPVLVPTLVRVCCRRCMCLGRNPRNPKKGKSQCGQVSVFPALILVAGDVILFRQDGIAASLPNGAEVQESHQLSFQKIKNPTYIQNSTGHQRHTAPWEVLTSAARLIKTAARTSRPRVGSLEYNTYYSMIGWSLWVSEQS